MPKVDRITDIEQSFGKVKKLEAALEPARDELDHKREEIQEIIGVGGLGSIKLAGLRFSKPALIVGGAAAIFGFGTLLVSPLVGLAIAAVAGAGTALYVSGVFKS